MNEQEKLKKLADLYLAMSEGEELRYLGKFMGNTILHSELDLENYTTVKKVHPLQCLIGTQILCYFDNGHSVDRGWLKSIDDNGAFVCDRNDRWDTCTPVKNFPNHWSGGECPVPEGMEYKVRTRNGEEFGLGRLSGWRYTDGVHPGDIIAVMFL